MKSQILLKWGEGLFKNQKQEMGETRKYVSLPQRSFSRAQLYHIIYTKKVFIDLL